MDPRDELDDTGMLCETKSLYNHSSNYGTTHVPWSEFENPTAEEQRILGLGKLFAVIHRYSRVQHDETEVAWVTHSIEARSPRLRKVLDQIFSGYLGWYPDDSPYSVASPFKPYVHRWEDISRLSNRRIRPPRKSFNSSAASSSRSSDSILTP